MPKIVSVISAGAWLLAAVACHNPVQPPPPPPPPARIIVLTGNLAFGTVPVGSSATSSFTIGNGGNEPLTVSGIAVSAGTGSVYASNFTAGAIAAGGSQVVTVRFTPAAAQAYAGNVIVSGDQTSGSNTIAISGTGLLRANIQASDTGTSGCFTGLCTSFTFTINNAGAGCATNVQVVTRFYGGDGAGPQLGIDVPMGLSSGGTLSAMLFRPGTTAALRNLVPFNDVRSAHTVFTPGVTWTDVLCP